MSAAIISPLKSNAESMLGRLSPRLDRQKSRSSEEVNKGHEGSGLVSSASSQDFKVTAGDSKDASTTVPEVKPSAGSGPLSGFAKLTRGIQSFGANLNPKRAANPSENTGAEKRAEAVKPAAAAQPVVPNVAEIAGNCDLIIADMEKKSLSKTKVLLI